MFADEQEYNIAYVAACRIEGYGLEATQILACPFCCTPDYQRIRIVCAVEDIATEAVCLKCERGTKSLVEKTEHGVSFEIVQTRGPAAPADMPWLPPIRRLEEVEADG